MHNFKKSEGSRFIFAGFDLQFVMFRISLILMSLELGISNKLSQKAKRKVLVWPSKYPLALCKGAPLSQRFVISGLFDPNSPHILRFPIPKPQLLAYNTVWDDPEVPSYFLHHTWHPLLSQTWYCWLLLLFAAVWLKTRNGRVIDPLHVAWVCQNHYNLGQPEGRVFLIQRQYESIYGSIQFL